MVQVQEHPKIVLIGLAHDDPQLTMVPDNEREDIRQKIEKMVADTRAAGINMTFLPTNKFATDDEFNQHLQSEKFDGICIGFGVRGDAKLTVLFEKLVNQVMKYSPQSKLLFNSNPTNTIEAVRRWFPQQ